MAKNFDELRNKMNPDRLAAIKNETESILADLNILSQSNDESSGDGDEEFSDE